MYEMTPWACHALGEEARRLRYCLRTSTSSEPNAASIYASCEMYVGTGLKAEGWEQSIDKASLRAAGFSPFEVVKQLRSNVSNLLSSNFSQYRPDLHSRRRFNSSHLSGLLPSSMVR